MSMQNIFNLTVTVKLTVRDMKFVWLCSCRQIL